MRQSVERATRCRPDDGATQLGADNCSERRHGGQLTQLRLSAAQAESAQCRWTEHEKPSGRSGPAGTSKGLDRHFEAKCPSHRDRHWCGNRRRADHSNRTIPNRPVQHPSLRLILPIPPPSAAPGPLQPARSQQGLSPWRRASAGRPPGPCTGADDSVRLADWAADLDGSGGATWQRPTWPLVMESRPRSGQKGRRRSTRDADT